MPDPASPIYYIKGADDALYRRSDGVDKVPPDQVLHPNGWRKVIGALTVSPSTARAGRGTVDGAADPSIMNDLSYATENEAKQLARQKGLPVHDW